jgi:hypothetical protein
MARSARFWPSRRFVLKEYMDMNGKMNDTQWRLGGVILSLLFTANTAFGSDPVTLEWIDVDSSGNFNFIHYNSGDVRAAVSTGLAAFLAGAFTEVKTESVLNGNPVVVKTINETNPQYAIVNGFDYPDPLSANNIFKIIHNTSTGEFTVSKLGVGVNGPVNALAMAANGDLYVGGQFSAAGGNPYSVNVGVYYASGTWNTTFIFSCFYDGQGASFVDSLIWDGTTLEIAGRINYARLQNTGGDYIISPVSNDTVYLHDTDYMFKYTSLTDNP